MCTPAFQLHQFFCLLCTPAFVMREPTFILRNQVSRCYRLLFSCARLHQTNLNKFAERDKFTKQSQTDMPYAPARFRYAPIFFRHAPIFFRHSTARFPHAPTSFSTATAGLAREKVEAELRRRWKAIREAEPQQCRSNVCTCNRRCPKHEHIAAHQPIG
jgi:hypothetical protein